MVEDHPNRVLRWEVSGNNSVVECDLAKVEVAGSNPVSRSNLRTDSMMIPTCCFARCPSTAQDAPSDVEGRGSEVPPSALHCVPSAVDVVEHLCPIRGVV